MMTMKVGGALVHIALALGCLATGASVFGQQAAITEPDNPLIEHMEFLVRDGGKWRTPFDDGDADGDTPRYYGLEYEWGPYKRHALGRITGIMKDERTVAYWHTYGVWNPATEQMVFWQIAHDGTLGMGTITTLDDETQLGEMKVIQPSGEEDIVRHEIQITGRDRHQTTTFTRNDNGDWERVRTRAWTRVKSP